MKHILIVLSAALALAGAAQAREYDLLKASEPTRVANSYLAVTPSIDWNQLGHKPGSNAEIWTLNGLTLDALTFYGGIKNDETMVKDALKKDRPLPHFMSTMLAPDVEQLFEENHRLANDTTIFHLDKMEPATFLKGDGFRFEYTYTAKDEVERKGLAMGAVRNGKLYLISFEAPRIYYFDNGKVAAEAIMASAVLEAEPAKK